MAVFGNATLEMEDGEANLSAISAQSETASLSLRGHGRFQLPQSMNAAPGNTLTIEVAAGATAIPRSIGSSIEDGAALSVIGLVTTDGKLVINGGSLAGNGVVGDVDHLNGIVSPGQSIGTLSVRDYKQGRDGMLMLELNGGSMSAADQLRARLADLSGIVDVFLAAGNHVSFGEFFDLVIADQINATNVTLLTHGVMGKLNIVTLTVGPDAGKQSLRLTVVPEPSSIALLVCASAVLCIRARLCRTRMANV